MSWLTIGLIAFAALSFMIYQLTRTARSEGIHRERNAALARKIHRATKAMDNWANRLPTSDDMREWVRKRSR